MKKYQPKNVYVTEGPQTQAALQVVMPGAVVVDASAIVDPIVVAAEAAHEANRAYCQSIGDDSQVAWADAPDWQKISAIKGVEFAIENNFPSSEAMHESWCAEKVRTGWVYGEVKDAEKKTHHCLVAYSELPEAQRKKDDIFSATVKQSLLDQGALDGGGVAGLATPEDDAQLADHEGPPIYEAEWNACLTMAFKGQGRDILTEWGNIPFVMAQFIANHRDAPDEAALIQVRLEEKVIILPHEDQRRVFLAVKLFRTFLLGWHAIEAEDWAARQEKAAAEAYANRAPEKIDLTGTGFEIEAGPFDLDTDLAAAAAARAKQG